MKTIFQQHDIKSVKLTVSPDMPKSNTARFSVINSGGFNLLFRLMVIYMT